MMNGLQAMPEGGTLLIKACCPTEETHDSTLSGERMLIQIEDEGTGIPSNLRQKVFEPFFTTKAGGTGLGAICVVWNCLWFMVVTKTSNCIYPAVLL